MLVDVFRDSGLAALKDIAASKPDVLPRLEKVASIEDEDADSLSSAAFAWPEERMYPIHTPEHALVSSVYLEGADDAPDFVKQACEEACALFGYDVHIGTINKTAEENEALTEDDFLLPLMRKLPAVDRETTAMSASVLEKNASLLRPDDVIVASRQLVKKAAQFGVDIDDKFRSLALDGHILTSKAKMVATDRAFETGDDSYIKVASELKGEIVADKKKVADVVFSFIELDDKNGISKTAADTITSIVEPGSIDEYLDVDGVDIPVDKVASIDAQDWQELFGRAMTEALFNDGELDFNMLKEVTASMSNDEKEALIEFIEQYA